MQSITVGIVGYPNVGKSSLINSMKRVKSVGVSNTPGFTKAMQEVQLDRSVPCIALPPSSHARRPFWLFRSHWSLSWRRRP
jgi:nuclear GTP-binding protein